MLVHQAVAQLAAWCHDAVDRAGADAVARRMAEAFDAAAEGSS